MIKYTRRDYETMARVQKQLAEVLRRVNREGGVEGALAAFALVRLAREILDQYPDEARRDLLSALVPFLRHDTVKLEGTADRFLVQ